MYQTMYPISNHVPTIYQLTIPIANNISANKPSIKHLSNKLCIKQCINQLTVDQTIDHLTNYVSTNTSYLQYFTSYLSISDNMIVTTNKT